MVRLRNIMLAICHSIKVSISTVLLNIVVHMVEKSLSMIVNPSKNTESKGVWAATNWFAQVQAKATINYLQSCLSIANLIWLLSRLWIIYYKWFKFNEHLLLKIEPHCVVRHHVGWLNTINTIYRETFERKLLMIMFTTVSIESYW